MKRQLFLQKQSAATVRTLFPDLSFDDGFDLDAQAYWAAMPVLPTPGRQELDNWLITEIKILLDIEQLSQRFDIIYFLAHETLAGSLLNVAKREHDCTVEGGIIFTSDHGVKSAGGYLNTHYVPAVHGVSHQGGNASLGVYCRDLPAEGGMLMGAIKQSTGWRSYLESLNDGTINWAVNSGGSRNLSVAPAGLYAPNRNANTIRCYRNGELADGSVNLAIASPQSLEFYILDLNYNGMPVGSPASAELALVWAGSSFSDTEQENLFNLFEAYLDAIG